MSPSFRVTFDLRTLIAAVVGRPIRLPAALLERHPGLAHARWRQGGIPPRIGGLALGMRSVQGITLGRTVFLDSQASLNPALLLHELAHVHQFERDGTFPIRYVLESLRRGYHANRYELEANSYAARQLSRPSSGA